MSSTVLSTRDTWQIVPVLRIYNSLKLIGTNGTIAAVCGTVQEVLIRRRDARTLFMTAAE